MNTIEEVLDIIAIKNKYKDWAALEYDLDLPIITPMIKSAMIEYAAQFKPNEQQGGVVRGGAKLNDIVPGEEVLFETTTVTGTPNTPTEPLKSEGLEKGVSVDKEKQKQLLTEIMKTDEEYGMYDE